MKKIQDHNAFVRGSMANETYKNSIIAKNLTKELNCKIKFDENMFVFFNPETGKKVTE